MSHLDATHVVKWSHITFDRPVPLIPRRHVKVGDKVMSSHGFAMIVSRVIAADTHSVVQIESTLGGGHRHVERYEGSIPLLERNGIVYGAPGVNEDFLGIPTVDELVTT